MYWSGLVLSEQTYRLTQGFFASHNLGEHTLKGLIQPILVYQVLQESSARGRLEAAIITGLTPLVGREQEGGLLGERWAQTKCCLPDESVLESYSIST